MKEFFIANWQLIVIGITAIVVYGAYIYNKWVNNQLEELADEVLDYVKDRVGARLSEVTRDEVEYLAGWAYGAMIESTLLGKFITYDQWCKYVWEAFVVYRDWYNTLDIVTRSYLIQ